MTPTRTLWLALPVLALGACNGDDPTDTDEGNGDTDDTDVVADATLRVVHASPNAPAVDVFVDEVGDNLFTGLAYGDTSDYSSVPAGTYTVEVRVAGTEDAAWTGELTVDGGSQYTVVAAGLVGGDPDEAFRVLPLEEGFAEVATDDAVVRLVHASPNAPTVDLDVGDDGSSEITGFERFSDSGADGVPLPSGEALQVGVLASGTKVTAFTTPELPASANLFVIATGVLGPDGDEPDAFNLLAVGPDGTVGFIQQNPRVYVLHASPDAPAVDLAAGDAVLASGLPFAGLTQVQVPPATYDLDLHASPWDGNSAPAFSFTTPALQPGGNYLAVATGYLGSTDPADEFRVVAIEEAFDIAEGQVGLRAMHASPDAPAVDIGTVSGGSVTAIPDFTNVPFPAVSAAEGVELAPGTVDLGVAVAGSTQPVALFNGVALAADQELIAVAAGEIAGTTPFRLLVVDTSQSPWAVVELMNDL
jgi:hypothetical protein